MSGGMGRLRNSMPSNPFDPRAVSDAAWAKVKPGDEYCWDPGDGDVVCKRKPMPAEPASTAEVIRTVYQIVGISDGTPWTELPPHRKARHVEAARHLHEMGYRLCSPEQIAEIERLQRAAKRVANDTRVRTNWHIGALAGQSFDDLDAVVRETDSLLSALVDETS